MDADADGVCGIVLAGTYRWSASSFEALAARPLVPVALSPLISYALRWLRDGDVPRATICTNHSSRTVEAALGQGGELGLELRYYEDGTPRGAAGCVRDAGLPSASETFVVADGTAIPTVSLRELLASHRASGAAATAVVHRDRSRSGLPTPGGVYVFERRALEFVGQHGFQDIKENLIPKLHRAGERVVALESDGWCPRVMNAQTYLSVSHWMLERLVRADAERESDVIAHPSAWVDREARLVGSVQLGPRVRVRAGATIVGPTTIGAESTVECNALVARSVVWNRCQVGEDSLVHGSVVGDDVVVPAATRLFHGVRPEEGPWPSVLAPLWVRGKAAARPEPHLGPALP
jgi:NDP-sugar pyrophosphorylase family protein